MKTVVIYRKWSNGDIIALFPYEDAGNGLCLSYEHIGQHGGASYGLVVAVTKPATEHEYAGLHRELTNHYGYDLVVRQRKYRY